MNCSLVYLIQYSMFFSDESFGGVLSDQSLAAMPIQTSLANLGVQLLASWSRFVTRRYHRGRGRIPRWANDACHFAYQLCQPRSVTFLEARKVAVSSFLLPFRSSSLHSSTSFSHSLMTHSIIFTNTTKNTYPFLILKLPEQCFNKNHSLRRKCYSVD